MSGHLSIPWNPWKQHDSGRPTAGCFLRNFFFPIPSWIMGSIWIMAFYLERPSIWIGGLDPDQSSIWIKIPKKTMDQRPGNLVNPPTLSSQAHSLDHPDAGVKMSGTKTCRGTQKTTGDTSKSPQTVGPRISSQILEDLRFKDRNYNIYIYICLFQGELMRIILKTACFGSSPFAPVGVLLVSSKRCRIGVPNLL